MIPALCSVMVYPDLVAIFMHEGLYAFEKWKGMGNTALTSYKGKQITHQVPTSTSSPRDLLSALRWVTVSEDT